MPLRDPGPRLSGSRPGRAHSGAGDGSAPGDGRPFDRGRSRRARRVGPGRAVPRHRRGVVHPEQPLARHMQRPPLVPRHRHRHAGRHQGVRHRPRRGARDPPLGRRRTWPVRGHPARRRHLLPLPAPVERQRRHRPGGRDGHPHRPVGEHRLVERPPPPLRRAAAVRHAQEPRRDGRLRRPEHGHLPERVRPHHLVVRALRRRTAQRRLCPHGTGHPPASGVARR